MGENMRSLFLAMLVMIAVSASVTTIVMTNSTIRAESEVRIRSEVLSGLASEYESIMSRYVQITLEQFDPRAREAGYITVSYPRYLRQDTVVGFLVP